MSEHQLEVGPRGIHVPHDFEYSDEAARVGATGLVAGDVKKLALQLNDFSLWMLQDTTPTWVSVTSGVGSLPFDAINDPAVDAAVTQVIIDANRGIVITLTVAGNDQTLAAPTLINPRNFIVVNDDSSIDSILINANSISPGKYLELYWDGSAWTTEIGGAGAGIPGGNSTEIQFNDGGAFGGDPNFTWDDVFKKATVLGNIEQRGGTPTNLYTPTIISTTAVGSSPRKSTVVGNYVYVVDNGSNDLKIFDVTDPTAPALIGFVAVGAGRGVDVAGNFAYVASSSNGSELNVIDITDKSAPVQVGTVQGLGGAARGCLVRGSHVFMTNNGSVQGLISIDVTDPTNPVVADKLNTTSSIRTEFDVVDGKAYIVSPSTNNNFQIIDVSDPTSMVTIVSADIGSTIYAVQVQGRYAYVLGESTDGLNIFDISDPTGFTGIPVGSVALPTTPASPRAISVQGNFAYIVEALNDTLSVVDISDPTTPVFISAEVPIGQNPVSISVVGRFAYITDNTDDNFIVVDIRGANLQNLNVGSIDAADVHIRRSLISQGPIKGSTGIFGQGGVFSGGDFVTSSFFLEQGNKVALRPDNVVFVYDMLLDMPVVGTEIQPASGVHYILMRPQSLSGHTIRPPIPNSFATTIIESSNIQLNTLTNTGTGSAFIESIDFGGLTFRNMRIFNTGSRVFANISPDSRTDGEFLLDNVDIFGFNKGTIFTNAICNILRGCFLSDNGTFKFIDVESNVEDSFLANFGNPVEPNFEIVSDPTSGITSIFTAKNNRWSANSNESFLMVHPNILVDSAIELVDNKKSIFTSGLGTVFDIFTGNITAVADSAISPGVKTTITAPGHELTEGDTVEQSGFVIQTGLNGTFIASNVTVTGYDVIHVFSGATDTGSWLVNSLNQKDIKILSDRNEGVTDSVSIGGFFVNDNSILTTIALADTFQDVDLTGSVASSNIEEWELTDVVSGELTYIGLKSFEGILIATINGVSASGTNIYKFAVAINNIVAAGVPESPLEAKATIVGAVLISPISVNTGDTVKIQIKGIGTSTNATISDASISVL